MLRHRGRHAAHVLWVSHSPDLALLTVDTPGFFEGVTPLELGEIPTLQQEGTVLGFPQGTKLIDSESDRAIVGAAAVAFRAFANAAELL